VNTWPRLRDLRYGAIISSASLGPRKMTVLAYIDATLLTPTCQEIAPPLTYVRYWITRR
jgi:hypothetical protein